MKIGLEEDDVWMLSIVKEILQRKTMIYLDMSLSLDRGRLAQLAARMLSMHKVAGSIPAMSSTDNNNPVQNQDASFFCLPFLEF